MTTNEFSKKDVDLVVGIIVDLTKYPQGISANELMSELSKKFKRRFTRAGLRELIQKAHEDSSVGSYFYNDRGLQPMFASAAKIDELAGGADSSSLSFSILNKPVQEWSNMHEAEAHEIVKRVISETNEGATFTSMKEAIVSENWTDDQSAAHQAVIRALKALKGQYHTEQLVGKIKLYFWGAAPVQIPDSDAVDFTESYEEHVGWTSGQNAGHGHRVTWLFDDENVSEVVIVHKNDERVIYQITLGKTISPRQLSGMRFKHEHHDVACVYVLDAKGNVLRQDMTMTDVYIYEA